MDNETIQRMLFLAADTVPIWRPTAYLFLIGVVVLSLMVALTLYFPSEE